MIAALASISTLGLTLGLILGYAAQRLRVEGDPLADELQAMLPGSQCGQCGFAGCAPAAAALAKGEAPVTLCPPGGKAVAEKIAARLGIAADLSGMKEREAMHAGVREELCIGCTKCFKVCPTDAIIGAPKHIHSVIAAACTGCGKCVDVCPTECLQLNPIRVTLKTWRWPKPAVAVQ